MKSFIKILIVEDNPGDLLLLKEYICLSKIPVTAIQTTELLEEAIMLVRQDPPDIVFLDLYLSDSSGLDTFERLKESANRSAIIILSGLSDTETALQAIALGAQDYLNKGEFDEKLLGRTINYTLERWRNLEKLRQVNERYNLATKATHDLIWDWDLLNDEVFRDEPSVKKVYGFSSNEKISTISEWHKRIHPDDAGRIGKLIEEMKASDMDFFELEYRFLTESGIYKTIFDRGYVVRNGEGKPIRLLGAAQDITERRKLETELEQSRLQKQRGITEATIKGQEKEREHLGKELHDNVNQILCTSLLYLDQSLSSPGTKDKMISQSREHIQLAIKEIRKLSHELLPPSFQEFGLSKALGKLTDTISISGSLKIYKQWEGFDEHILQNDEKLTIFRIVQEQLQNILKHAEAKVVIISLSTANAHSNVRLLVRDDGKGFNMSENNDGVGLRNIKTRGELYRAKVTIESSLGNGCELKVLFPLNGFRQNHEPGFKA